MRFDPADLRLFLNICLSGSISSGALRSNMAVASASARLRGMEDQLGARLLDRKRSGIQVTPAGTTFLDHARKILMQLDAMHADLSEYSHGRRGRIRLMCNTVTLGEFLPQILGRFLAANAMIDVDVEEQPSRRIVAAVADGMTDIGIAAYASDSAKMSTRLFRRDRLAAALAPDHPLAGRECVDFAELLDYDLVGLGADSAVQDMLSGFAALAGRPMKFRTRLRTFDGICRLAALGIGAAIVPEIAARRAAAQAELAVIPLADSWASRDLMICLPRRDTQNPLVEALVRSLTQTP